jgi:nitrate reductase NapAB chaperone NapD
MKELLEEQIRLLQKQSEWLRISYEQCKSIGIKDAYTIDEFGYFETLCSRFSRSIDFTIRKFLRTLDAYEFENQGTLVDVINRAHKRNLFQNIDDIRTMKDIRNSIVHEYIEEELAATFNELLVYTPKLLDFMQNSLQYAKKSL